MNRVESTDPASRPAVRAAAAALERGGRALDRLAGAVGDASRTVKFMRGRLAFAPRPDDVFVASYPRSGTTWTQLIVHYLVSGRSAPSFDHITDVCPWWERSLAYRLEAAEEFRRLPSPRAFKTHLPYRWLPRGARYLYLLRNPEDVVVSYYHLYRRYLRYEGEFDEFFDRFVRGEVQYRSWFKHTSGWLAQRQNPRVLILAYEDMKEGPTENIRRIADFLGVPATDRRVEEIARLTDFDAMKAHEEKFDHVGELCRQWGVREGPFLRQGRVSYGDGYMSEEQRDELRRLMERAGERSGREWHLPAFLH